MRDAMQSANGSSLDYHYVLIGSKMNSKQARACENFAKTNPNDLANRLKLIGYFDRSEARPSDGKKLYRHLLWFIQNHPTHFVHRWLNHRSLSNADYVSIRQVWINKVRKEASRVEVLFNAAAFFTISEPIRSSRYLRSGQKLEPSNVDWPLELSHIYKRMSYSGTLMQRRNFARKSISFAFRAIYLHRRYKRESYLTYYEGMVLHDRGELALTLGMYEEAKRVAMKLREVEKKILAAAQKIQCKSLLLFDVRKTYRDGPLWKNSS